MYTLKKNKRTVKNATFDTYEKARQEARKRIRKDARKQGMTTEGKRLLSWDNTSRNPPSISDFGYSVHKVS